MRNRTGIKWRTNSSSVVLKKHKKQKRGVDSTFNEKNSKIKIKTLFIKFIYSPKKTVIDKRAKCFLELVSA